MISIFNHSLSFIVYENLKSSSILEVFNTNLAYNSTKVVGISLGAYNKCYKWRQYGRHQQNYSLQNNLTKNGHIIPMTKTFWACLSLKTP